MVRCWQGGELGWDGDHVAFRRIEFAPTSVQRPHPPLWVGGNTGPALRRAARHADVWHPTNLEPDEVRRRGDALDQDAGRLIPRAVRLRVDPTADVVAEDARIASYSEVCAHVAVEVDSDDPAVVARWAEGFASRTDLGSSPAVGPEAVAR
jgi:alkanesulfonate monooxygenase SsuD/methylene tetrahydromethanopterin reductase-like flavin-dependent oxidoreductase (luciferase family)